MSTKEISADAVTAMDQTLGASLFFETLMEEEAETIQGDLIDNDAKSKTLGTSYMTFSQHESNRPRFTFENELGEGAYGKVWRAKDGDIGRSVAIKSYKYSGPTGYRLCASEIAIAGKLDHPGVPVVYDVEKTDDDEYHFIMKFIDGKPLTDIIEGLKAGDTSLHDRFSYAKRTELVIQILRVLSSVHKKGILHRDIKPENILIGHSGEAYLMDWGIALDMGISNGEGQLAGSPKYMSPEQAAKKSLDQRSDLYSIAAVLYELICLEEHGPDAESVDALLEVLPSYDFKFKFTTHSVQGMAPLRYSSLFEKALNVRLDERFQSADEFIESLETIQEGKVKVECPFTATIGALGWLNNAMDKKPMKTLGSLFVCFTGMSAALIYIGTLI
jgi:eukaryotic-like serine/threonine-protein kinase